MLKVRRSISRFTPLYLKRYVLSLRWHIHRLLPAIYYYIAVYLKLSLNIQIQFCPVPSRQQVVWTTLKSIKYHGTVVSPKCGRLCLPKRWDAAKLQTIPSIFEKVDETCRKWNTHETIRSIFLFGKHYTTTPQYFKIVKRLENPKLPPSQNCISITDVHNYFKNLLKAYVSMKNDGYLTQLQMGKPNDWEIQVHVTSNGELCLIEGNHRIRLAELINIESVAIIIKGIDPYFLKQLCNTTSLPPHKAYNNWITNNFSINKPG